MMNKKIKKMAVAVLLIILACILGVPYASYRKAVKENADEGGCEIVEFEGPSSELSPEAAEGGQIRKECVEQRIPTGSRYFDETEAYRAVLAEYELAQKSTDEIYIPGKWEYVYDLLFYASKYRTLYYSLADLSGDGHPELIIGEILEQWETPINAYITLMSVSRRPAGAAFYDPYIIYSYNKESGIEISFECEGYTLEIYENGIIFMARSRYTYYYRYQKNLHDFELVDCFVVEPEGDNKVVSRTYYRGTQDDSHAYEIPEKEYRECVERYESKPMELEWQPLEGFLEEPYDTGDGNPGGGQAGENNMQQRTAVGNKYFDGMEAYRTVLAEYKSAKKNMDEINASHKWEHVSNLLLYMSKEKTLYYSLADLSGDGYPELIMGVIMKEERPGISIRITERLSERAPEEEYYDPWVIYSYSEEGGIRKSYERGEYEVTIYEGGIVELSRAWHTYYYKYQKESGELGFLDHFRIEAEIQDSEVKSRTYYRVSQDESRDDKISDKEYWEYIKQYTSNPMELEWRPVEGFGEDQVQYSGQE